MLISEIQHSGSDDSDQKLLVIKCRSFVSMQHADGHNDDGDDYIERERSCRISIAHDLHQKLLARSTADDQVKHGSMALQAHRHTFSASRTFVEH